MWKVYYYLIRKKYLIRWLRLLPNVDFLAVDLIELRYWLSDDLVNKQLDFFLQQLDQLYVDCSSIINIKINEEIMNPLLLFVIDKYRFPRLHYLRFVRCKKILSSWDNIDQWIDFILNRITEHQFTCVRFDFPDSEQEMNDLETSDTIVTITEPSCIIDVHRFACANHVSLWMKRRQK